MGAEVEDDNEEGSSRSSVLIREILLYMLTVVFTLPLASIINRFLPVIVAGNIDFDLLISVAATFFLMKWLIFKYRKIFIVVSAFVFLSQVVGLFARGYSFTHVFNDYRMLVHNLWNRQPLLEGTTLDVNTNFVDPEDLAIGEKIKAKVIWNDSLVRNYSVVHCMDYFEPYYPKYGYNVRFLSLFKYINSNFTYIADAQRDEYFATPMETIKDSLAGDCDDHSILMASCMRAIGGEVRLVMVDGHIYPELGYTDEKQFNIMVRAIDKLFHDDLKDYVHYHVDNGKFWINMDYSASHPGGPYVNRKVLNIIYP
jgi:hypothetical protein